MPAPLAIQACSIPATHIETSWPLAAKTLVSSSKEVPTFSLQHTVRGCCDATLLPLHSSADGLSSAVAQLDCTCGSHRPWSNEGALGARTEDPSAGAGPTTLRARPHARLQCRRVGDAPLARSLLHNGRSSSQIRSQVKILPGAVLGQAQF